MRFLLALLIISGCGPVRETIGNKEVAEREGLRWMHQHHRYPLTVRCANEDLNNDGRVPCRFQFDVDVETYDCAGVWTLKDGCTNHRKRVDE